MLKTLRKRVQWLVPTLILTACAGERPGNLGVTNGTLETCPDSPNCVSSFATDPGHHIEPLRFDDSPGDAFMRLHDILARRDDTTLVEKREGYLRVEFHTILFVDDGEFLLDAQHGLIHLRSASRIGYSDLGKNHRRLEEIRATFATTHSP